jgi:hypothetical protein
VRFGRFCIDQHRQQVSRNGARIRLRGKVYQVLIVLLQKQGEVVTREELKQALWSAHASRGGRCHLLDLSLCSATAPLRFAKSKVRLGRHPRYALPFGDIVWPSNHSAGLAGSRIELRTKHESLLKVLDENAHFGGHPAACRPHRKNWHCSLKGVRRRMTVPSLTALGCKSGCVSKRV